MYESQGPSPKPQVSHKSRFLSYQNGNRCSVLDDTGLAKYWYLARASFRRALAYRTATWAGLITNLFWGFLRSYFYMAVLDASGGTLGGYDQRQMFGLTAWSQSLLVFLSIFGWWELSNLVKSGEVIGDLWRPADFYWVWQAKDLGRALHAFFFRGLPLILSYSLVMRLPIPRSPGVWMGFLASLILASLISFAYRFAINCIAFWTLEARGFLYIAWAISGLLTGFNLPVAAFPPWLQTVAHLTPFPSMFDTPLQIILERSPLRLLPQMLAVQALWVVISVTIARMVMKQGLKRLVVQGG